MPGLATVGLMAFGAKRAGEREREERERKRQLEDEARAQANEERQLRQALLLAQLEQNHIVPNESREKVTVGGSGPSQTMGSAPTEHITRFALPSVPKLTEQPARDTHIDNLKGRTDPEMYASMRPKGPLHETDEEADAAPRSGDIRTTLPGTARRTVQGTPSEEVVDQRRYRELGNTGRSLDLNPGPSLVEQRKLAQQRTMINQRMAAMKAKHPERYGQMTDDQLVGIASDDDAYRESLKDIKPDTSPTFAQDGSQRWDPTANGGKGALVPTGIPPRPRATPASATPAGKEKNDRDALQDRIGIITQRINQLQTAIDKAPYVAQRDTSQSAVAQRAASQRMRTELDKLQAEHGQLTDRLAQYSGGTGYSAPEGIDLSLVASASAVDQEKASIAYDRIMTRENGATLEKAMASPYLSPAAKAIIWKKAHPESR